MPAEPAAVAHLLRSARRVAVVGLSPRPDRPSHRVAAYLQRAGYDIVPVNPVGGLILGEPAYPDLMTASSLAGPLDIVDIFRRAEHLPALLDGLLAIRPSLVWMQVGVRDDEVAQQLERECIPVVMDRCLAVEHNFLGG